MTVPTKQIIDSFKDVTTEVTGLRTELHYFRDNLDFILAIVRGHNGGPSIVTTVALLGQTSIAQAKEIEALKITIANLTTTIGTNHVDITAKITKINGDKKQSKAIWVAIISGIMSLMTAITTAILSLLK